MIEKKFLINNKENLSLIIDQLFKLNWQFLYLNGDLGAGKTTLVQEIAKKLNIKEKITSPTFNIMKIYPSLVHIDAYHLKGDLQEFEDYFDNKKVIIEWSDNLNLDYNNFVSINIYFNENNERIYHLKKE
ncbi:tRNA (adenosine(37)-N6)-threonylcarbamoyltransferase complex ATPase subunit type 1 TsaE [Mesomycoplasma lagogenitalium]|uniref:tRNA threonylcarbamoyladenosine biosynthesis protein TsaE n=1 Tax=Mesomycoplasma lagogenitalium TaxID=171286 RepID=A0ABY8LUB7_9BACT|nr:tRNA (adenosine(37)-N6)-threonylcarbamoyltransferase complex ATPase subunit type 1 TsaE [Mesomycoplasma lagogenitalium]WGI36824.1 tRNA (adenosine(37)-N6)-threonylcarbamoyltransferase complex ATPase subunit type 1 TsaE [Mesomycoplasma lagogenitalium]